MRASGKLEQHVPARRAAPTLPGSWQRSTMRGNGRFREAGAGYAFQVGSAHASRTLTAHHHVIPCRFILHPSSFERGWVAAVSA